MWIVCLRVLIKNHSFVSLTVPSILFNTTSYSVFTAKYGNKHDKVKRSLWPNGRTEQLSQESTMSLPTEEKHAIMSQNSKNKHMSHGLYTTYKTKELCHRAQTNKRVKNTECNERFTANPDKRNCGKNASERVRPTAATAARQLCDTRRPTRAERQVAVSLVL